MSTRETLGPFAQCPPEILVKIFALLPPKTLLFSATRVNWQWRTIIHHNLRQMQLVPVHCRVDVMDMDSIDSTTIDGTHPMIQYAFTVFDIEKPDYKTKLKCCWRANGKWTQLYLTHRVGNMECEWENVIDARSARADPVIVERLLKYMNIEAMRFDVRKFGKKTTARMADERFSQAMEFCAKICTKMELKSLLLSSHNTQFSWKFGPLSLKKLQSLSVENIIFENMTAAEVDRGLDYIDLSNVKYFHLKFDPSHKQDLEHILWVNVNGSVLSQLLACHQKYLEFRIYSECPQAISLITAEDIVTFIRGWRGLFSPWKIRGIHFNATMTISEFRTVATRVGLYAKGELEDFPYCRFRAHHPSDPNAVLELSCYGNGVSTQWQIRSGYLQQRIND